MRGLELEAFGVFGASGCRVSGFRLRSSQNLIAAKLKLRVSIGFFMGFR